VEACSTGCKLVLVVEGIPPPAVPSKEQLALLDHLKRFGHGDWLRMQVSTSMPAATARRVTAAVLWGQAWFKQLDTDGSGALSPSEIQQAFQQLGAPPRRDPAPRVTRAAGLKSHRRAIREIMERLDSDGDGEVNLGEFMHGLPDDLKHAIESQLPRVPFETIQKEIRCDVECIALCLEVRTDLHCQPWQGSRHCRAGSRRARGRGRLSALRCDPWQDHRPHRAQTLHRHHQHV
jgi:hypothetical protein